MDLPVLPSQGGFSLVIPPDGDIYIVNLLPDRDALTQMREHLDCRHVDLVRLSQDLDMWLDDEGMVNHPINVPATGIARLYGHIHQPYFGPVLLCSAAECDSIDLTAKAVADLIERLTAVASDARTPPDTTA